MPSRFSRVAFLACAFVCGKLPVLAFEQPVAVLAVAGPSAATTPFVGTWRGTSTCVPPAGACHDEIAVYRFEPIPGEPAALWWYADKVIAGKREPMGLMRIEANAAGDALSTEFTVRAMHGRFAFARTNDTMTGTLVMLPEGRKGRDIQVRRVDAATVPAPPPRADYGEPIATTPAVPGAAGQPDPTPAGLLHTFAADFNRFDAEDAAHPPARGGIVFTGSSSIRMWPDPTGDLGVGPILNRGFGGSTMAEVHKLLPRVALGYAPRLLLIYAGDNDLNAGRTPQQVLADYRAIAADVHRALPGTRIVLVSIKPSPSRWGLIEQMRATNALLRAEVARDPRARFVDVFTPMLAPDGRPRPELYLADRLHMTPAGYAIWRKAIAPALR
jgi:lysophospholipase L1-like esterase